MADPNDPTNWYTAAANAGQPGATPQATASNAPGGGGLANAQTRPTYQGGAANPYSGGSGVADATRSGGLTAGGYDTSYYHDPGGQGVSRQVINPDTGAAYANALGQPITFQGSGGLTHFGNDNLALLGGDPNNPGAGVGGQNSYANLQNQKLQAMAGAAAGRTGPQMNPNAVNMMAPGVNQGIDLANRSNLTGIQALQTADRSNLYAVQNALDTRGLATGQNIAGQQAAAQGLMDMSRMPAGPSVAEQQLKMGADRSMQQQMAMASGARGGNTGLALQNAAGNQGQIMGDLNQQQGLLRAQEDMANRQFASNQLQAAANVYGGANQGQLGAYGQAANIMGNVAGNQVSQAAQLGNIANNQVNQGQLALGLTNTYADMAGKQLGADVASQGQNDQTALNLMNMGYGLQGQDRTAALMNQQNTEDLNARLYAAVAGINEQRYTRGNENDWRLLGGATGGLSSFGSQLTNPSSDIRAKRDVAPAGEDVSDAFRAANRDAATIRGTRVEYPYAPAYGYQYRDPSAPGSAPGTHYGPMAQDLERTPAGASVVQTGPDGRKSIDTQRLSLLNASETAKMRRELDTLKGQGDTIRGTRVVYPGQAPAVPTADFRLARLDAQNANDAQTLAQIDAAQRAAQTAFARPTTYPAYGGYGS